MKNSGLKKKLTFILVFVFFISSTIPIINGIEAKDNSKIILKSQNAVPSVGSEWRQLIGGVNAGFGKNTNIGVRGIEIFNDELYIGTQSFNKSKILVISIKNKLV